MAGDQRARRGHADEDRAAPVADRGRGLLAQRGVRLVADDDRVGVGDLARVADEPLVGLDRDRAVARVLVAEQGRRDPLGVAAVAQLAVELVDEVAAVGEDQDAAGARGLDEAERGDRLAGAGGVLEPEALGRVGVLGLLVELASSSSSASGLQSCGSSGSSSSSSSSSSPGIPTGASATTSSASAPLPYPLEPVAVALGLGQQRGQRARQRVDLMGAEAPCRRPASAPPRRAAARARAAARTSAASRPTAAWRRRRAPRAPRRRRPAAACPGASAVARSSPSMTKGSRVNFATRSRSAEVGACVAGSATDVDSAKEGETIGKERPPRWTAATGEKRSRARRRAG